MSSPPARPEAVQIAGPAGVLVCEDGLPQGVWCEDELLTATFLDSGRLVGDVSLPGRVQVAQIVRRCRFSSKTGACQALMRFDEKPDRMPPCEDPDHLGQHAFGW